MAFLKPSGYNNRPVDTIADIARRNGPGGWREPVAADDGLRCVLIQMLPGTAVDLHRHLSAGEMFLVVAGACEVELEGFKGRVESGAILFAPRDSCHGFVVGDEPLQLLCFLASNHQGDSAACT